MLDTIRISEKDLPGVKTWKKGGVYEVTMKVVMVADLESKGGKRVAPLSVLKYQAEEMVEEEKEQKAPQEPGTMLKSSIYGKPLRVENVISPSVG